MKITLEQDRITILLEPEEFALVESSWTTIHKVLWGMFSGMIRGLALYATQSPEERARLDEESGAIMEASLDFTRRHLGHEWLQRAEVAADADLREQSPDSASP